MSRFRFFSIISATILLTHLLFGTAFAGFFGSDTGGRSGLDFTSGYDVNTVTTMSGRVTSLPYSGDKDNLIVEIRNNGEALSICLGPGSYWEKKGIAINLNDDLSVKGSKAQGQDGKTYLIVQKVANRTTGAQIELRDEKGEPAWSARSMSGTRSERSAGSMRRMRSGGGMMRR